MNQRENIAVSNRMPRFLIRVHHAPVSLEKAVICPILRHQFAWTLGYGCTLFLFGSLSHLSSNLFAEPPLLIIVLRHYPFKLQPEHFFLQTRLLLLDRVCRAWSQLRSGA